jgi:ABC-type glycerol-3-phosphate transport system substrate-binding protein
LLRSYETAGPVSYNSNDDLERFATGNVGIILDGTWNLERLSQSLGDRLAIDPWPANGEYHLSGYVWTENIFINPSLEDLGQQAAHSLFEFMLSPTTQAIIANQGRIPAVASLDPDYPWIDQAITALSLGTPYPVLSEIEYYWEPMHQALVRIFEQGGDVSVALQDAADEIIQATRDFKNLEED